MLGLAVDDRDDLYARITVADEDNFLPGEVGIGLPATGVDHGASELFEARLVRLSRFGQLAGSPEEELALVNEDFSRAAIANVNSPTTGLFHSFATDDGGLEGRFGGEVVFVRNSFEARQSSCLLPRKWDQLYLGSKE